MFILCSSPQYFFISQFLMLKQKKQRQLNYFMFAFVFYKTILRMQNNQYQSIDNEFQDSQGQQIYFVQKKAGQPENTSNTSFHGQKQNIRNEQKTIKNNKNQSSKKQNKLYIKKKQPSKEKQLIPQTKSKEKKIQKIYEYSKALDKLRNQPKQFLWPFDPLQLNIDRKPLLIALKDAKDNFVNLRETVRKVGVRHQRNLCKGGVKDELTNIINYLETGSIPKWMKQHFQILLRKDLSNIKSLVDLPTLN